MSLLTAQNLGLAYGADDIFRGLSFSISDNARIGLVGPNGIGKTSLLRVLAGGGTPANGNVHLARGRRIGYLRQEAVDAFAARDHTVYAEMLTVFAHVEEQAAAMQAMEARMAAGDHSEALLAQYSSVQETFERLGGYDYDLRIAQVLQGLGFPKSLWETSLAHLSGGQKTRALLARLLLEAPNLLILDEPTNHLDIEAVAWLEETLRAWDGALLIVSHDRYFLDKVADHIWEMSRTNLEVFRGNYSAYVMQRQERWERRLLLYDETRERLEKELELARRYIAWRKMVEAKSKLKTISRELAAIGKWGIEGRQGKSWSELDVHGVSELSVEEAHRAIKALRPPVSRPAQLSMQLKAAARSGNTVLRTAGVTVGYPGKPLFTADDIELFRGECAALIGPNGSGKTTFLRTLLGRLTPLEGAVSLGTGLHVGYFAQAHDGLDPRHTVLEELLHHRSMDPGEARNYLAQYLFRGDDVYRPIEQLSGGERGRLALALLSLEGANFLLLDEPTNHLDIPAQESLQEQLQHFEGTLLLVSHDRYLVDKLATQIWELRDGRLHVFKGTYQELLASRERSQRARPAPAKAPALQDVPATNPPIDVKQARKRAQMLASLESQIAEAETLLAEWEQKLQEESEAQRYEEVRRASEAYSNTQAQLERLMESWATLAE